MRIRTHAVAIAAPLAAASRLVLVVVTGACASTTAQAPESLANHELAALRQQQGEQTRRIAELETRLALLESDARNRRDADVSPLRAGESVRLSSSAPSTTLTSTAAVSDTVDTRDNDELDSGKRPSLRLYGNGSGSSATPPTQRVSLPAVPEVSERLAVVPLPEQRARAARNAAPPSSPPAADSGAREQYRRGLRALQDRRFEDALAQFSAFVSEHPQHELVASALYWRCEAHYAARDYSAASRELESLIARFPSAQHTPDALLKLGLSLRKLGAQAKADAAFQRLRTDYPNSQAARTAAREGST